MICGSGGSKSRLAKAGQVKDEKLQTVVARSTFASEKAKNTSVSDHFWKFRCRKSARRCGAKHICKSKCSKHLSVGPLLEVQMSKKCTPLWREAHFEVKMCKTHHGRTTFGSCDVEKVHAVVARSTFWSQNVQNTPWSDHFWKLKCQKSARRWGAKHISKSKCEKHQGIGPLLDVQMSFRVASARDCAPCQKWAKQFGFCSIFNYNHHYTTLHSNTLHYNYKLHLHYIPLPTPHSTTLLSTPLHYTTFHYTTLHYTTLHYTALHYTPLHYTTLHFTSLHYTPHQYSTLHSITLHYTTLHYTTRHYTTLHYTTLHCTALHCTALHCTALHTALHCTALHCTLHYTTLD